MTLCPALALVAIFGGVGGVGCGGSPSSGRDGPSTPLDSGTEVVGSFDGALAPLDGALEGPADPDTAAIDAADQDAPVQPEVDGPAPDATTTDGPAPIADMAADLASDLASPTPDAALPDVAPTTPDAMPDVAPTRSGYDIVFDLDRLHVITIQLDPQHIPMLNDDSNQLRVPAVVTFDGLALPQSGIRRKGFFGSRRELLNKSGLTVDFHEFVPGQRLHGLKKLTLNNAVQDASFLHEHLLYEIYRRAGLPAPFTAHALVTINGMPQGLYVLKEHVDGEFLDRNFGGANDQGNLYEGPCCHDFATSPEKIELKDEVKEMRSRQDLLDLAQLIVTTPDAQFEAVVGAKIDLDNYITSYAVDAAADHFDDLMYNANNFYLYNHPGMGKFLHIPHGADKAVWSFRNPLRAPENTLALKIRAIPALNTRFIATLRRVLAQAYDVAALNVRIDRVAAAAAAHTSADAPTSADFQSLRDNIPIVKQHLVRRQEWASDPDNWVTP